MGKGKMKIFWLTAGYFLDVDLPVVPQLLNYFDIDWVVLTAVKNLEDDEKYIRTKTNCPVRLIADRGSFYSRSHYNVLKELIKEVSEINYDCYYFDISDYLFLFPLIKRYLPVEKVIVATHNVSVPKGARLAPLARMSMRYILNNFKNFQVFSKNQFEVINNRCKNANILYAPLMLKDYGDVPETVKTDNGSTNFLFFGNIVRYKRLDVLMLAVSILAKRGIDNFKVFICGYCQPQVWEKEYLPLIHDESFYHLDIRRIPTDKVAEYFSLCHYFVMPYQDIAQSGAMTVALNYNLPIIASDLPTFHEFITGDDDSYFFETANPEALADIMEAAIKLTSKEYEIMKQNLKESVMKHLSTESILTKYRIYLEAFSKGVK